MGVKALKPESLSSFRNYKDLNAVMHANNSVVEIEVAIGGGNPPDLPPEVPHLQYWREILK